MRTATPLTPARAALVRAVDDWLLLALIVAVSVGQLAWEATHRGGKHDSSRPGHVACVLLQINHVKPLATGTKCNAVNGFCEVTRDTTCSAVGPVPYIQ